MSKMDDGKRGGKRGIAWMLGTLIAVITIVLVFAVVASLFVRVENNIETWNSKRYAILVANRLSGGSDGLAVTINGMKHKNVFYKEVLDEISNNPIYQRWMTVDQDLYCYNWHAKVIDFEEPDYLCPHLQRVFQAFETFMGWCKDFLAWFEDHVPGVKQVNELAGKILDFLGTSVLGKFIGIKEGSAEEKAAAARREKFYGTEPGVRTEWSESMKYGDFKDKILDWCKDQETAKNGERLTWDFGTPTPGMFHSISEILDEVVDEDIVGSLKDTKETLVTLAYNPPSTMKGGNGMSQLIKLAPPVRAIMEACASEESMKNQMDPAGVPAIDILRCAKKWVQDKEKLFKEADPVTFALPVVIIRKGSYRTLNDDWSPIRTVIEIVKGLYNWVKGMIGKAINWLKCQTVCRLATIWEKKNKEDKGCSWYNVFCKLGKAFTFLWEGAKLIYNNVIHIVTLGAHGYTGLPPIRCVKMGSVDCRFCDGCDPPLDAQGPPEITQVTIELQSDDEIHMGLLEVTVWKNGGECRNVVGEINDDGEIIIGLKDRKMTTTEVYGSSND